MADDGPNAARDAEPNPGRWSDLKLRLVSALALGLVTLAALFAGTIAFAVIVLIVSVVMSWEWGRIVRSGDWDLPLLVHALAVALAAVLAMLGLAAMAVAVLLVGTILLFALTFGGNSLMSALGVLYTGLPAVALIWIREDAPYGLGAILFLLIVVATTDTFAFLTGRLVGGPKLIPQLSPNKTWSGLIGGVLAAGLAGVLLAHFLNYPWLPVGVGAMLLGLIAQAGDFAESALKRSYNVKDASQLIPGHGGFMDRMDGLVSAANAAALAALFVNPKAPAQALLFWT